MTSKSVQSLKQKDSFLRGFGPSEFQSSKTLQSSIQSITIPKAERFKKNLPKSTDSNLINKPCTLNQRAAFLGYGEKNCYPMHTMKIAKENPGPNHYIITSDFENNKKSNKGKSFGLSYKEYAKVKLPHIDILNPEEAKYIPEPGKYNVSTEIGKDKTKAIIFGKGKTMIDSIRFKSPAPNHYTPKSELVLSGRYHNLSFGSAKRNTFQENQRDGPGPGAYLIKSKFDVIDDKRKFMKGLKSE